MKTNTENTAQHTPGPWIAITPPSFCPAHRFIEAVRENESNITIAEIGGQHSSGVIPGMARITIFQHTANARLISAAPELLESLQNLLEYIQTQDMRPLDLNKARAAIAKATGGVK